jgi:low temperature requirement protein LtrA
MTAQAEVRVSTIELFFDLVFVFTITQLTHLIDHAHGAVDFVRALVVLVLVWWIYAGYAWLTNGVGAARRMRLVLIAGAAGFLVISQAIPGSFGADTLAFGLAYLFVVALHLGAFALQAGPGLGRAILGIAPFNLGAAALVIAAAFVDERWKLALFAIAAGLFILSTILHREQGFTVHAGHFVERHGAVILIVFGESIVAIGAGLGERSLSVEAVAEIALSMVLIATLWWCYFDRDDQRAEHAMAAADPKARGRMAILGYWYAHLAMICGVVLLAAGVKQTLAGEMTHGAPWLLSGGIAVYLAGDAFFRTVLGLRPLALRWLGAAVAPAFGLLGTNWGAVAELGALSAFVTVLLAVERQET